MPINQFQSFGLGAGSFVMSPGAWAALPVRSSGFPTGILPKENLNTALRQATSVSAMVAAFIAANQATDVLDDGNLVTLRAQFVAAIQSLIAGGQGTNRYFEAHNAVSLGGSGVVVFNSNTVSTGITQAGGAFTINDAAGNGLYQLNAQVSMGYTGGAGSASGQIQFTKNGVPFGAPAFWGEANNTGEFSAVTIPQQVALVNGDVIRVLFTALSGPCQVFTGYGNLTGFKIA